jgi:hypothetical protein
VKPGEPVTWAEAEAIAIRPSVEDAIEALLADQTLDNATGMVISVLKAAPPAQTPTLEINPGERYAGLVLDAVTGLPSHHLVLLPGEAAGMSWEDASKWAKEQGGDLPTRQEQSLLFANLISEFQPEWYWSGEKASTGGAWYQGFYSGHQARISLGNELRVRAVRRLSV